MLNFNGVEIKGLKYIRDHENLLCPIGSIYYNNKKVGDFRSDEWGGELKNNVNLHLK